jgi:hypothetical protein
LSALAQALHQVAHPHARHAITSGETLAHHALQRAAQITMLEVVVGEGVEDVFGVEIIKLL